MTIGSRDLSNMLASYTIVLASIEPWIAIAVAKSLKAFGAKVLGVVNYALEPCRFSRYFDQVFVLSGVSRKSSLWAVRVAEVASTYGADLVIPVYFVDLVSFSSHSWVFDKLGVKLAAPNINDVLKASRKDGLEGLVGDLINVPRSLLYMSPDEINLESVKSLRLPIVVKGVSDGSKPEYFSSYELAIERARNRTPCIVQEYVAGVGRGYYAVAFNGEVLLEFTHERIYETDPSGGGSIAARGPLTDPRLFKLGRGIVRRLNWTGPLMVETKWVPTTGEYYLMELNPKFWGSLALPVSLGYHFPAVLALAYLEGLDVAKDFSKRLLVQRKGEYFFLLGGLYYLPRMPRVWISMMINSRIVKSEFELFDPARVFMQFALGILGEVRSRKGWQSSLDLSLFRLKSTLKKLQAPIAGVIFDLDGTLVKLQIPWSTVRRALRSKNLIYEWEDIREGFARLWNEDRSLYHKASMIVEEFELKYSRDMEILVDVDTLNDIRKEYKLTYCLATLQPESISKDVLRRAGLHVDLVLGRDSGLGPIKENLYYACIGTKYGQGRYIAFDDDMVNIVSALRAGCIPITVTESKYHKVRSLRIGIPFSEPRHLHRAILSLLKGK
jgi:beta-phosphoglucomutase-like phosphatase (HAD superfamily)